MANDKEIDILCMALSLSLSLFLDLSVEYMYERLHRENGDTRAKVHCEVKLMNNNICTERFECKSIKTDIHFLSNLYGLLYRKMNVMCAR